MAHFAEEVEPRRQAGGKVWFIGILVAVAVLVAAWLVYRASTAAFSDQAQVGGGVETAGAPDIAAEITQGGTSSTAFDLAGLTPGDSKTVVVKASNVGSVPFDLKLYSSGLSDDSGGYLSEQLDLTISSTGAASAVTTTLAEFGSATDWASGLMEDSMAASASIDYTFEFTLNSGATNDAAGKNASITLVWEAQTTS
ncbi:hypothetical protein O1R50_19440 [Glycomyces luteolus]|uniref:Camelysin metallo-endopeptidase n=1 Tax=Glycomyces luteolus TaxID=2670330 RepID=A0A9X3SRU5_9ACTN|nr:hypothetical protein [Glycomyces luteolus]MDA1361811.1 hypothetical protein [Glycomyces luteolus]